MDFKEKVISLIAAETKLSAEEVASQLSVPPTPELGDYAFPCFKLGKNPHEQAESTKKKIILPSFLSKIEVAGPYLNFFLNPEIVAKEVLSAIKKQKSKYGAGKANQNLVLEFCGPNTNKPLHLGHLRNMSLGQAINKILSFQGNTVHPVNIINDRGIHICQSLIAYQKWGNHQQPDKKGDHFVGDFYVRFAQELKHNPSLKEEAQEILLQWERKDPSVRKLWKTMNRWVLQGFAQTYKRFGIRFEKEYFESEYYEHGKEIAFEGLQKKVFIKDDTNAIVAPLQSYQLSDKVILRGDGTSLYITQDLYLAEQRYRDFQFDRMIYVVASEQNLHFKQLFKILALLEKPYADTLQHVSYGLVNLPTGRMKSREGTVVDADDIMNEMSALAETEIRSRHPDLAESEIKHRAEQIGLAAIKFFMLKTDTARDVTFNPEESLRFEGETGPYIQYTHARACSLERKAGKVSGTIKYSRLSGKIEQGIITLLLKFPALVEETAAHYKVHLLCHYLLSLAQAFNEFYHACPVLSEEKELLQARLALVKATRQVLANGLTLLGIAALEEM